MSGSLKAIARELLPPVLLRALGRASRGPIRFTGDYASWDAASAVSSGYDLPAILERVKQAALKVKSGEAAYERDSVLFDRIEYSWPLLAALMWVAAANGGVLRVLDFGGSLGTGYFQNRKFLRGLDVSWHVVEQPAFVRAGKEHFEGGELRFHESLDDAVATAPPDVIVFGASLQYLPDPYAVLARLASVDHRALVIDRTPFSRLDEDRIVVQHVPPEIYPATYPMRVFSRERFLRFLRDHGWTVIEHFDCAEGTRRTDRGLEFEFGGLLSSR